MQPIVANNGSRDPQQPGQILTTGLLASANTTNGNVTLAASYIAGGLLNRTGPASADFTDTFPTADQFLAAIANFSYPTGIPVAGMPTGYGNGVQVGAVYEFTIRNAAAFNMTTLAAQANTGVTIGTNNGILANSARVYTVTINNATPPQTFSGSGASGQKVITGMTASQTALLQPGMAVYGVGVAANSLVASVQQGVGVTLDTNISTTLATTSLTFTPRITVAGKFTASI